MWAFKIMERRDQIPIKIWIADTIYRTFDIICSGMPWTSLFDSLVDLYRIGVVGSVIGNEIRSTTCGDE